MNNEVKVSKKQERSEAETTRTTGSAIGGAILGGSLFGLGGAVLGGIAGILLGESLNDAKKKEGGKNG